MGLQKILNQGGVDKFKANFSSKKIQTKTQLFRDICSCGKIDIIRLVFCLAAQCMRKSEGQRETIA